MVGPHYGPGALFCMALAWLFFPPATAVTVNRTIDDSFGDSQTGRLVSYLPTTAGVWKNQTCSDCAIVPNILQAFKRTYTAATYNPGLGSMSATMQFNGTAIYVYFILANNAGPGITTLTLANFTLDGNPPQAFQHTPDLTTEEIDFNALVFSQTNLTNTQHTLVISTSGVNTNVYVNFDYAIYTTDDAVALPSGVSGNPSSPPVSFSTASATEYLISTASSGTPTNLVPLKDTGAVKTHVSPGAVAGGVIGALVGSAFLAFGLLFLRRQKLRKARDGANRSFMIEIDPSSDQESARTPAQIPRGSSNFMPSFGHSENAHIDIAASSSRLSVASIARSPMAPSDNESAYGGYVAPSPIVPQTFSNGNSTMTSSSTYPSEKGKLAAPLRSVTDYDSLSSPANTIVSTPFTNNTRTQMQSKRKTIEDVRRARQQELDHRLRTVQQEMFELSSDLNNTGGPEGKEVSRHRSFARRTLIRNQQQAGVEGEEEEMSVDELKEQLRAMKKQVVYLQQQQRSAWAQGLSDDPPPGYTATRAAARYSQPPPTPPPKT